MVEDDRGRDEAGEHRNVVVVKDRARRVGCTDRMARREIGRIMILDAPAVDLDAIDSR